MSSLQVTELTKKNVEHISFDVTLFDNKENIA